MARLMEHCSQHHCLKKFTSPETNSFDRNHVRALSSLAGAAQARHSPLSGGSGSSAPRSRASSVATDDGACHAEGKAARAGGSPGRGATPLAASGLRNHPGTLALEPYFFLSHVGGTGGSPGRGAPLAASGLRRTPGAVSAGA